MLNFLAAQCPLGQPTQPHAKFSDSRLGGSGRPIVHPMFTWAPYWVAQDALVAETGGTTRWKAGCTPLDMIVTIVSIVTIVTMVSRSSMIITIDRDNERSGNDRVTIVNRQSSSTCHSHGRGRYLFNVLPALLLDRHQIN